MPRIPILMQFATEYIGSDYAAFASDYRVLVKANEACAKDFGFDQLSCVSDSYRETHAFGSKVEFVENAPPRSTHPLLDTKDLSVLLKPDPLKSERMLDRIKAIELYKEKYHKEYSILGWIEGPMAEAADLRDASNFIFDLIDDEEFAGELMDICVDVGIEFARAQVNAGADTIAIGDALASQVGPDIYERLILPREKRLVKAIQDMGAYVKLHICGNITHLLPGIAELGIDIIDVDYMVDLITVRKVLGDKVTIAGNMDPVAVIKNGRPETIRKALDESYAAAGNPFMVNPGCEIPSGTPYENLKALCEPVKHIA